MSYIFSAGAGGGVGVHAVPTRALSLVEAAATDGGRGHHY